jgi:multiple sugar transport system substrate-binding protein
MRNWPYVYGVLSDPQQSQLTTDQVGIAPLPITGGATRSYSCLGGWNLMINAGSPFPDAAFEFIQYLASPDAQRERARKGGFLPTLAGLYDEPQLLDEVPVLALGRDAVRNSRDRPQSPIYSSISPRIARAFTRVLTGQATGAEAVAALQRELRQLIRRYG